MVTKNLKFKSIVLFLIIGIITFLISFISGFKSINFFHIIPRAENIQPPHRQTDYITPSVAPKYHKILKFSTRFDYPEFTTKGPIYIAFDHIYYKTSSTNYPGIFIPIDLNNKDDYILRPKYNNKSYKIEITVPEEPDFTQITYTLWIKAVEVENYSLEFPIPSKINKCATYQVVDSSIEDTNPIDFGVIIFREDQAPECVGNGNNPTDAPENLIERNILYDRIDSIFFRKK